MPQVFVTPAGAPAAVSGLDIGCRVSNSATTVITAGVTTVLAFNGEDYDTDTMHDNVTNNGRITITTAGKYTLGSYQNSSWNTGPIYGRNRFIVNGATGISGSTGFGSVPNVGDNFNFYNFTRVLRVFAAADFVTCSFLNVAPGGGTITIQTDGRFWARKTDVAVDVSCVVKRSAAKTITNGANTPMDYDLEDFDTDTMHDNAVNNTRLTVNTAGKYEFWHFTQFVASALGTRDAKFRLNGATDIAGITGILQEADSAITMTAVIQRLLAATDYVEHYVNQSSLGNLDVATVTRFGAIKDDHFG